jgi:hypothetical protein
MFHRRQARSFKGVQPKEDAKEEDMGAKNTRWIIDFWWRKVITRRESAISAIRFVGVDTVYIQLCDAKELLCLL